ncbi:AI-2E family transporter [Nocardioides szechwanensis]|uniref:Predicted PurR-regulated permease PerM n=1 Tax=Nocardioides szechwanensis TaxID=1005944 RepID=A0A1H0A5W4_9ACTN|nr:AI-2E family transporter [Nocardioides szechwanensis]GEP34951.1 AI-2E family transporter [Nocardioides szechwanensis]SDN28920.1 Predicted PurR-regulated permease PerM [Nocardioides szechwanensis]
MSNDDAEPGQDAQPEHRRRLRLPGSSSHLEPITQRLAHQWSAMREERRSEPPVIVSGPSNFNRAQVPWGLDLAAAWGWRFLVIVAAGAVLFKTIGFFSVIALPAVIALLISALVSPVVSWMARHHVPRGIAAILVVLGGLGMVGLLLTFAGQQVANGANDLADSTVEGLEEIKNWLKNGPVDASESQINNWINQAQDGIASRAENGEILSQVTSLGSTLTHVLAGFFIVLFSTFFFLADGERIWAWMVRLSPRAARSHVDSSGRVAWISLTQFVRATVLVALVDAVGIMIGAAVLRVPFVLAIGVLVFLGSFVPMIGASVAGTVAVLVALVDQGPITALLMLGVVIGVQQIEGHVLQPFLMGRWVSMHPLGVIFAIGAGVIVAGVAGALVAVPLAAAANAVVQHLATYTPIGDEDPVEELRQDYEETGTSVEIEAPVDE